MFELNRPNLIAFDKWLIDTFYKTRLTIKIFGEVNMTAAMKRQIEIEWQIIQSELNSVINAQEMSKDIYKICGTYCTESDKFCLEWLFKRLQDSSIKPPIKFQYMPKSFYRFLVRAGLAHNLSCKKIQLTDLFWETKYLYDNNERWGWKL